MRCMFFHLFLFCAKQLTFTNKKVKEIFIKGMLQYQDRSLLLFNLLLNVMADCTNDKCYIKSICDGIALRSRISLLFSQT